MGRGGKRANAGRPMVRRERAETTSVSLYPTEIAYLKRLGKGSISRGIQEAVKRLTSSTE